MRYVYLAKEDLPKFVKYIMRTNRVMAPVRKEHLFAFEQIEDPEQICLGTVPTILPPKKYFMPQNQTLGTFKMGEVAMKDTNVDVEPTVLFGVNTCDIEGIECLDVAFSDAPADPYFSRTKKSITIIGHECMKPCDESATCMTMDTHNPKAGYDIMMTDAGNMYILHVNSQKGDELVKGCSAVQKADESEIKRQLSVLREKKQAHFKSPLKAGYKQLFDVFEISYKSKEWESVGKRCVSCGNCTAVCPTCYCFNITDRVALDVKTGERSRQWDSCQLQEFAEVAGGENFREERSSRQRHRYFRKFNYSIKKFHKYFCVGCGRCTRTCMAKINLIETVNTLTKGAR